MCASTERCPSIRVLIADDHAVVIQGLASTLRDVDGYDIVGFADNGVAALEQVDALHPDIVIMDVSMPGMNGIQATREIKQRYPETRVIVYTMHSDREYVLELFEAGMDGYVLKQDPMTDLLMALGAVRGGGTYFSTQAPRVLAEHLRSGSASGPHHAEKGGELSLLSEREMQVFTLLADGYSIKEISAALFISPKTVESHKYSILAKLQLNSVTEMTKLAIRLGLITT